MYLIPIAWLYVALMMSVAEATNTNGTVLGAIVTFVLYGLLPVGLIWYFITTPARKRALRAREAEQQRQFAAGPPQGKLAPLGSSDSRSGGAWGSIHPDTGSEAPADPVTPVGKEP